MYQVLTGTNDSYNREYSKGYGDITSIVVVKHSGKPGYNVIGNIAARAAASRLFTRLFHLYVKHYGIYDLYNCPLIGMHYAIIKSEKLRK